MPTVTVTRTYLQLREPSQLRGSSGNPVAAVLVPLDPCSPDRYRELYAAVGGPYHWRDRNAWSDEQLLTYLASPTVRVTALEVEGKSAGYFELMRHDDGSVEIVYFGLAGPFIGLGLGKFMLTQAAVAAWSWNASRVWLHTCTLDNPAALPNYKARGFEPYGEERYEMEL